MIVKTHGHVRKLSAALFEIKFNNGNRPCCKEKIVDGKVMILILGGNKNGQDKDIKRAQKQPKKSIVINGVELIRHDPSLIFKNHREIKLALSEALMGGDKDAFVEILSGYVRAQSYQ